MRVETVEEERDRYKKALETLSKLNEEKELDIWTDKETPLGAFLDMELNFLSYRSETGEHLVTQYGVEDGYGKR